MDARKCGLQWAARAKNSRFSVERIGESQRATALLMCVSCLVRSCATSTCYGTTRASEAQSPVVGAASSPSAPRYFTGKMCVAGWSVGRTGG
eukprot:scaffold123177_cov63-Phaeocystis_antarctica.AAC.6